jgi:hypothetical protein
MSSEELFRQVERLLQRKLSAEECKFLIVARQVNNLKKKAVAKAANGSSRVA